MRFGRTKEIVENTKIFRAAESYFQAKRHEVSERETRLKAVSAEMVILVGQSTAFTEKRRAGGMDRAELDQLANQRGALRGQFDMVRQGLEVELNREKIVMDAERTEIVMLVLLEKQQLQLDKLFKMNSETCEIYMQTLREEDQLEKNQERIEVLQAQVDETRRLDQAQQAQILELQEREKKRKEEAVAIEKEKRDLLAIQKRKREVAAIAVAAEKINLEKESVARDPDFDVDPLIATKWRLIEEMVCSQEVKVESKGKSRNKRK